LIVPETTFFVLFFSSERKIMRATTNKKQQRLAVLERHIERLERRHGQVNARYQRLFLQQLMVFIGGIVLSATFLGIFVPLGLACFIAAIILFIYGWGSGGTLRRSIDKYDSLLRIKKTHVARMVLDWENIPPVEDVREKDHPFENDLQISGLYSLHQLINTSYSDQGRARLRQWLLKRTPDAESIRTRQSVVRELTPLVNFRDRLQAYAQRTILDVNKQNDQEAISLWLDLPLSAKPPLFVLIISSILSVLLISLFVLLLYSVVPLIYVLIVFGVSLLWTIPTLRYRSRLFLDSGLMATIFKQLDAVFSFIEKYPTTNNPHLQKMCEPFQHADTSPSKLMKRLHHIARYARLTQSQTITQSMAVAGTGTSQGIGTIFNLIVPWDLFLSYFLGQCKDAARKNLPLWLDAWYELEALCSLATFAYLNPDYVMPELTDGEEQKGSSALRATQLGHPLIPDEDRVVNNVTIEHANDIMLITGSNMAGKSTFLRTMGINLCLAYAGSVVSATVLQTRFYEINCCISVSDSLSDGYSYFYAEVRRLRFVLDRVREKTLYPVFVLIDEIFKGTNNRERLIGSRAYIYALAESGCLGGISTHDLELVTLSGELEQIKNYHFRDDVIKGEMVFDYTLYRGPCPTTNALKIMQKEGLPITWKQMPQLEVTSKSKQES
jgi:VIT1/CCC1 family predicted Fe2+/Mn2+ transporter/energy-coupling factor transporter ATP-binding protein EcfA2